MRLAWLAALIVGCGDDLRPPPDGASPMPPQGMDYRIRVAPTEPPDRPPPANPPLVFIDGVQRTRLDVHYDDEDAAIGAVHAIELRLGAAVVARQDITLRHVGCLFNFDHAQLLEQDFCEYDSGDLRFASEESTQDTHQCFGDNFCFPRCFDDTDCPGARCTSRATSISPFASHLACAPAGPRALGESCALVDDPEGAFDDCGAGLLCVAGTCRTACRPRSANPGCAGCSYVPGHAPEIGACP